MAKSVRIREWHIWMCTSVCAHVHANCFSSVFLLSLRFQVWALLFPNCNQTLYLMTLESALCSRSRDYLAELLGASDDFEQPLMGWRNTVNKLCLYLSLCLPSFFSGRKLYPLSFQRYKIVILCLRFLKLGEDANGSRGKAVWRKFRRLAINQSIVKM